MSERHRVRLHYQGGRPIVVTGPATGMHYRFSGFDRRQLVDPRDALVIVKSGAFQLDGVVELTADEQAVNNPQGE